MAVVAAAVAVLAVAVVAVAVVGDCVGAVTIVLVLDLADLVPVESIWHKVQIEATVIRGGTANAEHAIDLVSQLLGVLASGWAHHRRAV